MTILEYNHYSEMASKLFNYMNGKINNLNSNCTLYIDMYDYIHGTYGNIRYPNYIYIHIGTIVDSWDDSWVVCMSKESYVGSCIAWALSHELHHADQLISMIRYNTNPSYKESVENDVSRASYDWVYDHRGDISLIGGFEVTIKDISSTSLPDFANYQKASVKEFYLQTIANIIIRDLDLFNKFNIFTNDLLVDDIVLTFNDIDSVVIKSKGIYLIENINIFSSIAFKWAGYFDVYKISTSSKTVISDDRKKAYVYFNTNDSLIHPMTFKAGH